MCTVYGRNKKSIDIKVSEKIPLGRLRLKDNIKIDPEDMNFIGLA
jgi:hypothetical protein